jgi:hypothetical protein
VTRTYAPDEKEPGYDASNPENTDEDDMAPEDQEKPKPRNGFISRAPDVEEPPEPPAPKKANA